jgi:hypothetical protein
MMKSRKHWYRIYCTIITSLDRIAVESKINEGATFTISFNIKK